MPPATRNSGLVVTDDEFDIPQPERRPGRQGMRQPGFEALAVDRGAVGRSDVLELQGVVAADAEARVNPGNRGVQQRDVALTGIPADQDALLALRQLVEFQVEAELAPGLVGA